MEKDPEFRLMGVDVAGRAVSVVQGKLSVKEA